MNTFSSRKILSLALGLVFCCSLVWGQKKSAKQPKLVVAIVVDQMRFDFLYKYESKYSENGFKRLLREGFNLKNAHHSSVPTVTAAGHASIHTGTTPSMHGIIGNSWFDRNSGTAVGNVQDTTEQIVGSRDANPQGVSPKKLKVNTISDQLRQSSNFEAKVISISMKDRGAALPGGHNPNGVYWYDWQTSPGYFVTSTYYTQKEPQWVTDFNQAGKADQYLSTSWNTLLPIDSYTESAPDNNPHERVLQGKTSPVFPYAFGDIRKVYKQLNAEYQLLLISPSGDQLLTDFAMEAIKNEGLGQDEVTDMLNLSYSVPDVAGHTFGPQSVEIEDIYLRLDLQLARLLTYLDEEVGKGDYTLLLTADHGAIPVASYLHANGFPAGVARPNAYAIALDRHLDATYGAGNWVQNFAGESVYLNRPVVTAHKLQLKDVQAESAHFLEQIDGISQAWTGHELQTYTYDKGIGDLVQNGFYQKRSGDVTLAFDPGFIQNPVPNIQVEDVQGTTHGSGYAYDTHVPLVWFGFGVPQGSSTRKVSITDIVPSLTMLLHLQMPNGVTGEPLVELPFNN